MRPSSPRLAAALAFALLIPAALAATAHAAATKKPDAKAAAAKGKAGGKARKKTAAKGKGKKKPVFLEKHVAATRGGLPNIQAQGALVVDMENGRELYSRNPDQERPIASISKLAATLVVMDRHMELEGLTTMTQGDADVARGGAPSRLKVGMTLSNRDLLHAALLGSDNRAIPAMGRAVGLQPLQLAAAMTKKAHELGLKHTRFREPTGLSPENVSTPRELISLLQTVMKHPVLGAVVRKVEYEAHPVGHPPLKYVNTHKPAHRPGVDVLGGKTGFNNEARYCLVLSAAVGGHPYCMAFLSTEGKLTRFGDVARVTDWIAVHKVKGAPGAGAAVAKADHGGGAAAGGAAAGGAAEPAAVAASTATAAGATPTPASPMTGAVPQAAAAPPPAATAGALPAATEGVSPPPPAAGGDKI